ncbi:hypothetical protein Tco_0654443 [Tanacetum coccineum]|uniref:Retroviral polymerase SH3-like domain-containing protein n=1 Tax=Tanacetum coccineum TaxID=301880 RepID=A0ABQ4X376_9ASTR
MEIQIALNMRNKPDIDEIDIDDLYNNLRVVAMLTVKVKKFIQRTGRNMDFKEKRHVSLDNTGHLIKDYDFYDQKSPEPRVKNVVNTGERVVKPVKDIAKDPKGFQVSIDLGSLRDTNSSYPFVQGNPENQLQDHAEVDSGKSPSISFMRPFGCPLTILNTLDSLGKFDGKSDEGYLLGYSTSSNAFKVYNKWTKRVEENQHINFLENQPNVEGTCPNWMFDLDFLTNSMNYIPVSVENQVIIDAGTQDSYVAGSSGKDKGPTQEYILLPLQPHRIRILAMDVVQDAQEQPSKNASPDKGIQVSEDVFDKEGQHQMPADEQDWQDEHEIMVYYKNWFANAMNEDSRQAL